MHGAHSLAQPTEQRSRRITAPAILLGVGLGGFADGIVLHQVLQWHHMLTAVDDYPATTVAGLEANTLWDGVFHALSYVCVGIGLFWVWLARDGRSGLDVATPTRLAVRRLGDLQPRGRRHRPPHLAAAPRSIGTE